MLLLRASPAELPLVEQHPSSAKMGAGFRRQAGDRSCLGENKQFISVPLYEVLLLFFFFNVEVAQQNFSFTSTDAQVTFQSGASLFSPLSAFCPIWHVHIPSPTVCFDFLPAQTQNLIPYSDGKWKYEYCIGCLQNE